MNVVHGDLIKLAVDGRFDVVVHGCNCQCTMGAGIAKLIREQFPEAYEADRKTVKGDRSKLGTISYATIKRGAHELTIVNGYTQFHWRGRGVLADYDTIRSVMTEVKRLFSGKHIGYPTLGAGLAKGDWTVIAAIVDEILAGENHTLVRYSV